MRTLAVLTVVLSLAACSKKKSDGGAAPAVKPAAAVETKPAEAPAAPAASASKLNCDKVFPQSLRDKYFANAKVADFAIPVDITGKCIVSGVGDKDLELEATCHDNIVQSKDMTIQALKKNFADIQEIAGVGNPALAYPLADGTTQVTAFDDDSNCQVMGTLPKGTDAAAVLKDWLAVLPPK
jgi:hypothetical protein